MSYIIENTVKGHTYLYECKSWYEGGKIPSWRKSIGKIDLRLRRTSLQARVL
jgi:hypothetical protein